MIVDTPCQAHSVRRIGIRLESRQVAALVWQAAHGRRLHWKIHYLTYALTAACWALPFLRRPLAKYLCLAPPGASPDPSRRPVGGI